jgi:hypothetical protein
VQVYISHRGNLTGPNSGLENSPDYVQNALWQGFDVEIDVWRVGDKTFLGHDGPTYDVTSGFVWHGSLWCHAKNPDALVWLLAQGHHCFWHQEDDMVLTSQGHIWTYPGKILTPSSIAVMPERVPEWDVSGCYGICSDYVETYKERS